MSAQDARGPEDHERHGVARSQRHPALIRPGEERFARRDEERDVVDGTAGTRAQWHNEWHGRPLGSPDRPSTVRKNAKIKLTTVLDIDELELYRRLVARLRRVPALCIVHPETIGTLHGNARPVRLRPDGTRPGSPMRKRQERRKPLAPLTAVHALFGGSQSTGCRLVVTRTRSSVVCRRRAARESCRRRRW